MIDAVVISDSGDATLSASSPLRLQLDGRTALIQNVRNYLENGGRIVDPVRDEDRDNWHCAPKLNGIQICDYLLSQGFETSMIDSYFPQREKFRRLLNEGPKAVIVSTTFILNKATLAELVTDIRDLAPDIYIIVGGPFVYSSYLIRERLGQAGYDLAGPRRDFLFLDEGERNPGIDLLVIDKGGLQVVAEALSRLKKGVPVGELPNTARWNGAGYEFAGRRDLEPTGIVIDWDRMPDEVFESRAINIQASIGCPFQCEFCNFVKDRRYTRVKPVDDLFRELRAAAGRGIKYVRFVDDNFRLGRRDLDDICRRLIDEDLGIQWMSFIRASTLDEADIGLLKKAGCIEAQMGIESADRVVLQNMRKDADPAMYKRVIERLLAAGINCSCCFITGFPGETEATFDRTVEFIQSVPDSDFDGSFFWSIYPFLVVPLSPVYEPEARAKHGLSGYMEKWKHATMTSADAVRLIKEAFMRIDNASPIYSGDNIRMMQALGAAPRKAFIKTRHELSKAALAGTLEASAVIHGFERAFKA